MCEDQLLQAVDEAVVYLIEDVPGQMDRYLLTDALIRALADEVEGPLFADYVSRPEAHACNLEANT